MRPSTACFFLLDQNVGLVEGVLQTVPNWQQSDQSPGSAHVWPKGGASICSTDPRSAGGSPINHWSLTTLIEEGPGLTRHTLKATMVETYDHSLVAFRTVPGTHRRRHLQEAMVFCSHVEMSYQGTLTHGMENGVFGHLPSQLTPRAEPLVM